MRPCHCSDPSSAARRPMKIPRSRPGRASLALPGHRLARLLACCDLVRAAIGPADNCDLEIVMLATFKQSLPTGHDALRVSWPSLKVVLGADRKELAFPGRLAAIDAGRHFDPFRGFGFAA